MNVLITGAGSGMGKAAAEYYAEHGHYVYAIDIKPIRTSSVRSFMADVSDESSLIDVRNKLQAENASLDLIIHFAGILFIDNFLEVEDINLRRIFEINVLGAMRVNKVFFGLLKRDGRIIITTSEVAPLDALPFNGVYSVTKTALDAYAQALRHEAGFLGVRVITVRPGAVNTPLCIGSVSSMQKMVAGSRYFSGQAQRFEQLMRRFTGKMLCPDAFAERIYKISLKKHPHAVYTIHANVLLRLLSFLPAGMQVRVVRMLVGKT